MNLKTNNDNMFEKMLKSMRVSDISSEATQKSSSDLKVDYFNQLEVLRILLADMMERHKLLGPSLVNKRSNN